MSGRETERYSVWVNSGERIASFRAVDGYDEKTFARHEYFMSFLQELQKKGYRFQ